MISLKLVTNSILMVPRAQRVGQQGSEAVRIPNFTFFKKKITTENRDTSFPFPQTHTLFRNFPEKQHRRVHLRCFSVIKDKKLSTENCNETIRMHKIFRVPKFSETLKGSLRKTSLPRQNITKNRGTPSLLNKVSLK